MEGGQVWLLNCLNSTLDVDPGIRKAAEDALNTASSQPGTFFLLSKYVLEENSRL